MSKLWDDARELADVPRGEMADAPLSAAEREAIAPQKWLKYAESVNEMSPRQAFTEVPTLVEYISLLVARLAAAEAGREAAERALGDVITAYNTGHNAWACYDIARRALASGSPPRTEDGS